ncbi:hypothetical protein GCM10009801_75430 [Streptomyces albiaxialis]|uniref:Uncharacterized protein n=1 Tax=Streptomyces albiaxialis TaxID=329523 RepID=A0ABP5IJV0_9ACTN
MGDAGDLQVDESTVRTLTKGINSALDELREVGTATDAAQGSGFEEMKLTKKQAGDKALSDAFEGFCEEWEWGVRGLMADADEIAQALGLGAGMTWEEDRYRSTTIKQAAQALSPAANPHTTEDELAEQGYGDAAFGLFD